MILIVSDNQQLALNSAKKIRDLRKRNDNGASSETKDMLNDRHGLDEQEESKTPTLTQVKRIPALFSKGLVTAGGYDSDNHEKSIDSTTTSSTAILQNNMKMRK